MADYKVPRHIRFVEDFPRTSNGKIQRFLVAAQAKDSITENTVSPATAPASASVAAKYMARSPS
jgi:acyl-coenzyme A synthetase/AMP-(fatty) acid ligase